MSTQNHRFVVVVDCYPGETDFATRDQAEDLACRAREFFPTATVTVEPIYLAEVDEE